jgi:hypothetical protein
VLAFTDWGVLAYVLTAWSSLRCCWPQRSPTGAAGQPAADRGAREAPLPCSTTTPEASRKLAARRGPARPSGAGHQRHAGASGRAGPQLHPHPADFGYVYPVAQRWRETGVICWIPARRITPRRDPHLSRGSRQEIRSNLRSAPGPEGRRLSSAGEDGCASPHPCAIHGSARAAKRPDSTAPSPRYLISLPWPWPATRDG